MATKDSEISNVDEFENEVSNVDEFEKRIGFLIRHLLSSAPNSERGTQTLSTSLHEVTRVLESACRDLHEHDSPTCECAKLPLSIRSELSLERTQYEELLDFSGIAHLVTDSRSVILEANQQAATLVGDSLTGRRLLDMLIEVDQPPFRDRLESFLRNGGDQEFKAHLLRRHSVPVPVEVKVSAWNGAADGDFSVSWLLRPVGNCQEGDLGPVPAARFRSGSSDGPLSRRFEAGRLQELVHGIDAILWETNLDGSLAFISRRAEEVLGYPVERWLSDPGFWLSIIHPEDREAVVLQWQRNLRQGRDGEQEYRVLTAEGRYQWLREGARVIRGPSGDPLGVRGSLWNVNRRKKVERQLYISRREVTERLAEVSYLNDLILNMGCLLERDQLLQEVLTACAGIQGTGMGVVRLYNPTVDALEAVSSMNVSDEYLDRFGQVPVGVTASGEAFALGHAVMVKNAEALPDDSAERDAARLGGYRSGFHTPLVNRQNEPIGALSLLFRLPHRPPEPQVRLVEGLLRHAANFLENADEVQSLREADHRMRNGLASLAHELRTPISSVLHGAYGLVPGAIQESGLEETRSLLIRQSRNMSRLVEDLLLLTKSSRGEIEIRSETLDLSSVLENAVNSVHPLMEEKHHELIVTRPPEPLWVDADPLRLEQVFTNLLVNAARYTDPGGRITLTAWAADGKVAVRLLDTGRGIAPDLMDRIFQPFVQGNPAPGQRREGLGLGLTLVKNLVELHGGTISAASAGVGQGSEFMVLLPGAHEIN